MSPNEALTRAADYCWERARDCLVARDRIPPHYASAKTPWQAKADAFTEAAQAIQNMRS